MAETRLIPIAQSDEFVVPDAFLEDEYRDVVVEFHDEFRDRNDRIRAALQTIREGDDAEVLRALLKDVHSLKGTGGSIGYSIVTSICHVFEELLIRSFRDGEPCDGRLALETADRFAGILAAVAEDAAAGERDFNKYVSATNGAIAAARTALAIAEDAGESDGDTIVGAPDEAKRVLVVEGIEFVRRIVEASLSRWPHISIDRTARAGEALDRAASEGHDLAIISRDLDGASGTALLCALRAEPDLARLPIILIELNDAGPLPPGVPAPDRTIPKDREFVRRLREAVSELLGERVAV